MNNNSQHITPLRLITRNLRFYWQKNLLLALGISISAAIITGALIVGDSVKFSLGRIVSDRLGEITYAVNAGDRFFTISLGEKIEKKLQTTVAPALQLNGIAISGGGAGRANKLDILGVNERFDILAGSPGIYSQLKDYDLVISQNLATRLSVNTGDEVLLRITRASLIPMNAPFVSDADNTVAARFTISAIAGRDQLGMFNLENSQTAPYNAFISLETLNELMEFKNKANLLLIASKGEQENENILKIIADSWTLEDAGLHIHKLKNFNESEVSSERVFIEEGTSSVLLNQEGIKYPVLTYFVNSLSSQNRETPYSFVSTLPDTLLQEDEAIINQWLAEDINAGPGDTLKMRYFIMGPLRELFEEEASFIIHSVVKMEGRFADRDLMPHLPGLSDAGNCRDWETGIPIDLGSIRDKDEKYWEEWRGTPKAFIAQSKALQLWQNRFGNYTAFRYNADEVAPEKLEQTILNAIHPAALGFTVRNLRSQGNYAAMNGVNFSELFAGLSFFLLAAGILLSLLLFLLNLEFRKEQLKTLSHLGIPSKLIFRIMFIEGIIVGGIGAAAGLLLAILYNQAVFSALNGVWKDIVRTEMMSVSIQSSTLAIGFIISLIVSLTALYFPLRKFMKQQLYINIRGSSSLEKFSPQNLYRWTFWVTGILALLLIVMQLARGEIINSSVFFIAGGLLLISGIGASRYYIARLGEKNFESFRDVHLSLKNALRNPARSMTIVVLFALATFLVVSTGSNRKDLFVNANDPTSGTGGFLYYAESTVPVLHNLNTEDVRYNYGLSGEYSFVQFHKAEGDDASCLNLNRISNPEIIAADPGKLAGRFQFVTKTPWLDENNPWTSLEKNLPGGLIPAIADETVIKWGLMMQVGDTLRYTDAAGNPMDLLLVGGLAPSIFQGKVIISERHFLDHFPQSSGTSVFLVEGNMQDSLAILDEIHTGMRDFGMEISLAAQRLAEFSSVTNTYLAIFMVLGALGLLLGTIGLGIVLFKSILERKNEVALLQAVGINKKMIRKIISREYFLLLTVGTGIGFATALIATLPSILSPNTDVSFPNLIVLLAILLINGWLWTRFMTEIALKNKKIYESLRND